MGKFISGTPTRNSLDKWHSYSKHSYHPDRAQLRNDLSGEGASNDAKEGMPELPRQKREEGRCWADIKATTADKSYTGKGGSKRD